MTEAEWLTCAEPRGMLDFLRDKASDRKLRLFACACCRRIWPQLTHEKSRQAIELAEEYADGDVTDNRMRAAERAACSWGSAALESAAIAARMCVGSWGFVIKSDLPAKAQEVAALTARVRGGAPEHRAQAALLRDLFGNPFRLSPRINPAWLAWDGGTVGKLAQATLDERAFDRLPVLADALEEAGCDNADIVSHCRQPGLHVRGCWALDLLLGRQ